MSNSLLKKYKKKLDLLDKYNKFYYQKQRPLVPDLEYDKLKIEILELEKKNNLLDIRSPSLKVGYKPSKKFEKFRHKVKMLSLSNAFNKNDLINFQKKIFISLIFIKISRFNSVVNLKFMEFLAHLNKKIEK